MSVVVLGIGGGIAAYKACLLSRLLSEAGHEVHVVPTRAALEFIGSPTWEALSGHPVHTEVFDDVPGVEHVRLAERADVVVVAPATADLMARIAGGHADDLLTATVLTTSAPVLLAPAMHTGMWHNAATVDNVATLRRHGIVVKDPASGRLTGRDSGPGRLPDPDEIAEFVDLLIAAPECASAMAQQDLAGKRIVVSLGGTREAIDPVRYLGNSSSGRMGRAIAQVAAARGADVHIVAAHTDVVMPSGVQITRIDSTEDLADAMDDLARQADVVIQAAAAADFAPVAADTKIKKHEGNNATGATMTLHLHQTPDVLARICSQSIQNRVVVGFAAETAPDHNQLLKLAQAKLARKGCDLLVVNDVSGGKVFGKVGTDVTVVHQQGPGRRITGSKSQAAVVILDEVHALLATQ
ncbi:bifunctional phosphopantothenoylcysteine decarboxylase/phosphopantothenate--cysteine ligase CoaBC [Cutibacterium modestum]|uniref:bifunctional phosphopantothenoylcysteine decarboxylase/phosphopantothenate--cysteine ligase CoaBC n=1 Tax=Cutibacterium modestum TaxID=2559073 RepID=UPI000F068D41|nr:bifunctional phosphopantothenoylcysteine decarboxylase/phosphopantothenate--cysteine ligase CoaBC [Cutibacterium modestum]MCP2378214.1 bifunctional phosphopantothenoylcysteine decarboxylase/phosphopantothenate synthase [Cutibacterium modestum 31N]